MLLPLFISAFKRGEDLIIAMEARNYTGGNGRTKMRVLKMGRPDAGALIVLTLFTAAMAALTIAAGR